MWCNPDKRCDVMVGSSAISIEQLQEFQEASPEVGEQETSRLCEGGHYWLYCPPNIFKMTCDRKCLAKNRYYKADSRMAMNCQSYCYGIHDKTFNFSPLHSLFNSFSNPHNIMSIFQCCCGYLRIVGNLSIAR